MKTRPQQFQKNLHLTEEPIPLERHEKINTLTLHKLLDLRKHNIKTKQLKNEHFSSPPQPMELIAMHLIGEFHPASSKGNRYALTEVCMLTGFTFSIPLKSKHAEDVIKAYIDHICCSFGPSRKILTDNGTEFKNRLWTEVFKKLKTEQKFTPIYSPQCNGRIEGFHKFLKATIG